MRQNGAARTRRDPRDLSGTDPEHLDSITNSMVHDVMVVDRAWVYRFGMPDLSKPLMRHEAQVLDLVRAHVDVSVPYLEMLGDGNCRCPCRAGAG